MKIYKFLPSPILSSFIKEFTIIESEREADSMLIPDTSMAMAFRFRGKVLNTGTGTSEVIPDNVVSGLRRSPRFFRYEASTSNLIVVFKEAGFASFTKIPAHELFGESIASENVFLAIELTEISERLAIAKSHVDRIVIVENFLLRKLIPSNPDHLVAHAIQIMNNERGIVRMKDLAASLHLSQDPFEKRFRTLIGCSPKHYASVIRLKNLIKNYSPTISLTQASYDAGYFDQSHFIKDFRQFTGRSPKAFFASARYW